MNPGTFFLVFAVALAAAFYVVQPFLERRGRRLTAEGREMSALMAERDRVVNALQELDFDFNLNKIPAEDYPLQRAELLQKGAEILKKLDELGPSDNHTSAEDRVEKAVAARRADLAAATATVRDDEDVEALIAARRKTRKEKSGGFCPRCGKPVLVSDRFCPHCGKSIN
jgi:NADH pyrophosphatase NudC (nudix superfamily)